MFAKQRPIALGLLAAGLLAGWAAGAQEKPRTDFGERVEVNEVLLDALVTDRQGKVIVGLGKDDFVVREDGKPVELTGVTFYSSRRFLDSVAATAKRGLDVDRVPQDRYFLLFFEDQRAAALEAPRLISQQIEAGRRAREWVQTALEPNDWVAVVGYDNKLKVYQDWTHNRRALSEALDDAIRAKDADGNWPSRLPADGGPSLLANLPKGDALRDKTANVYDGLRLLAEAAGKTVGRKNLVLFGTGFGRINSFGQYVPDERYYPEMQHALNDNNVAVYTVDLTPVGTTHTMSDAMNQLASDTGGRYFFDVVNFKMPLGRVAEENGGYYLLSYRSEKKGAGKAGFQKVEVKTTNGDFKVKARQGYTYGGSS